MSADGTAASQSSATGSCTPRNAHSPRTVDEALRRADLPKSLDTLVRDTVRRTRLRRRERVDIARELISHLQEGLEADVDAALLARTFGDPKRVAPLLRKAARRRRNSLDRFIGGAVKWGGLSIAAIIVLYLAVAVRMTFLEPRIGFDPFERFNSTIPEAAPGEAAWPRYRAAMTWHRDLLVDRASAREDALYNRDASDEEREAHAAMIRAHQDEIAALRSAAAMPTLGVHLSRELDQVDLAWFEDTGPIVDRRRSQSLFDVQIPQFGTLRGVARMLRADAELALADGDGARAVEDVIAMLGVARHAGQIPFLIGQLVETAILAMAVEQAVGAIERSAAALSTDDLVRLQRALSAIDPQAWRVDLSAERLGFEDFLQRTHSDDGSGDGVLLPGHAARLLGDLGVSGSSVPIQLQPMEFLLAPAGAAVVAGRRETLEMADRLYGLVESEVDAPIVERQHLLDREIEAMMSQPLTRYRHAVILLMLPAISRASDVRAATRTHVDGAIVAIALERYRRDRGAWPTTLDELVPNFLSAVPDDAYDGQPLRYRIDPAGPLLWSVGPDGVDDGGQYANHIAGAAPSRRPRVRSERGDLILFDARGTDGESTGSTASREPVVDHGYRGAEPR